MIAHSPCSINNLTLRYSGQSANALEDITLDFRAGKMSAIVGPNGAGKSSLLKAALGLIKLQSGSVQFFGHDFKEVRKKIAYVPQRANVDWDFPIHVKEVVMQGLYSELKLSDIFTPKKHHEMAMQALEKVGLSEFANRQISQLSGGQQQRMFLARALVQGMMEDGAELYILDEPFAGVDASTEKIIVQILKDLTKDNKSVIAVHHNLASVPEYFDDVTLINRHLIAYGPVNDVFTENNIKKTYLPLSDIKKELSM
ncbi:MAG: metal ABC transporter ATP-binding protein [Alphaproteobacteria bacterium]